MKRFEDIFKSKCSLVGMIHVPALPGTPAYKGDVKSIIAKVKEEAKIYSDCGVDAIAIENMHDTPYLNRNVGSEIIAMMTRAADAVKSASDLPTGIQVLAGANKGALAVALASDLQFIRAEGFVFSHIADEGMMNSDAGELLRYRKMIEADDILIFTDVKKKHSSHSITSDISIKEVAKAAEFFRTDGVIITGTETGSAADLSELKEVKKAVKLPVIIGSGITDKNIEEFSETADALIVGSYFKKDGYWENGLDPKRIRLLTEKLKKH